MLVQSRPGYTTDTTAENAHESMHFVWPPQRHCTCPAEGGGGGGGGGEGIATLENESASYAQKQWL